MTGYLSTLLPTIKQHDSAKQVRRIVGNRRFQRSTIAVNVRNPWDALVSYYRWERSGGLGRWGKRTISWDIWLEQKLRPDVSLGGISQAQNWLFYEFLFVDDGPIEAHLIRFENIDSSLSGLSDKLGIEIPRFSKSNLHFKNSRKAELSNYRNYYSDKQAELVATRFSEYLDLTGYRF